MRQSVEYFIELQTVLLYFQFSKGLQSFSQAKLFWFSNKFFVLFTHIVLE